MCTPSSAILHTLNPGCIVTDFQVPSTLHTLISHLIFLKAPQFKDQIVENYILLKGIQSHIS